MSRSYFDRFARNLYLSVRKWRVWRLPRNVLAMVFVVEALAVVITAVTAARVPVDRGDWLTFLVLALSSMVHLEAAKGIERVRETLRADAPFVDLKSVWTFAGVLLLPPPLAVALVVVTFVHLQLRVVHSPNFRWIYSGATVVLATHAAAVVLQVGMVPGAYPALPEGWNGVFLVVLAGVTRWFVNHGLVVAIILVSSPQTPSRIAVGSMGSYLIELAGVSFGAVTALVMIHDPWYLLLILPPLLLLHRSLLLHHYELAARTDEKTGLANAMHWSEMARRELSRAERDTASVGILMVDLDHFKRVNDTYGHLAGDAVLKAVADTLRKESRDYDLPGRFGGEEFVVLLPGVDEAGLLARAERLRERVAALSVPTQDNSGAPITIADLTTSIGASRFPAAGRQLDDLLLAADTALYKAKEGGRNRTCLAPEVVVETLPEARTGEALPEARTGESGPEVRKPVPGARKASTLPEARKTDARPETRKNTVPEARKPTEP